MATLGFEIASPLAAETPIEAVWQTYLNEVRELQAEVRMLRGELDRERRRGQINSIRLFVDKAGELKLVAPFPHTRAINRTPDGQNLDLIIPWP